MRFDYHNHTIYSNARIIDSINYIDGLIDCAIDIGLSGIAITDHEILSAHPKALKYYEKVKEKNPNFKLALGDEIYLVDNRPSDVHYHYILLAKDAEGHKILRILSSLAWLNMYESKRVERVDTLKSDLERYVKQNPGHLIASTACIGGELGKRILAMAKAAKIGDKDAERKEHDAIVDFINWNKELFGDDFYIETQPGVSKEQIIVNQRLALIAQCLNVKITCTSDSHYLRPENRLVHKSYLNSNDAEREVDAFYADAFLHTDEEMIEKFAKSGFDKPFVETMFANTMEIYSKITDYTLFHTQQIPKVEVKDYPKEDLLLYKNEDINNFVKKYPILSKMYNSDDKMNRYWVNQCVRKLKELNKDNDTYFSRLEEEARVKKIIGEKLDTNIFAYPIVLQHYIDMFWDLGSPVGAGRGSSCSGLNHYLLGDTQLDPIEWDLPFWRYLNEDRAELPDIDIDIAPSKRPKIIQNIKDERGKDFYEGIDNIFRKELGCTLVATFGTEATKRAIQTSCRGYSTEEYPNGIDIDTAAYLSSLIPSERGMLWDLHTVLYGDEENNRKPVQTFINAVSEYPGLLEIIEGVEGLISSRGTHASGVIMTDEDPFEYCCYMRSPSGDVCTQYDLHDAEWCGITKYDFLVTEAQDKIAQTINLLQEDNVIEKNLTLREVYNKYLHPSILPIEDEKAWRAIRNVEILELFQFDSQVGQQAAKKIKPSSMIELADSNGLMRLMAMDTGETPLDKYVRFKNDISLWYDEMRLQYHLTEDEIVAVKRHFARSHGVPPSQEQLMTMLMDKDICGFTLAEANKARKIVGKKLVEQVPALKEKVLTQAKSNNLGKYIWDCGIGPQMSYSFSVIHALAYSFIAFQIAYLSTNWNPIYWNTACLIVDSKSLEEKANEEIVDIYEEESDEDVEYEDLPDRSGKKKKTKAIKYDKIATAIGKIKSKGINISLININESGYTFKPDAKNNRILYGLKPISRINDEMIEKIFNGRPYTGIKDFMIRCPLQKLPMINLIKAGAFDEIEKDFNSRIEIMAYYLMNVSDLKKKLTLSNLNGLIQYGLIPDDLFLIEKKVFLFNKYVKNKNYQLDQECINFLNTLISKTNVEVTIEERNGKYFLVKDKWKKVYDNFMLNIKTWMNNEDNYNKLLFDYNLLLFKENWNKYAAGNISHWEMNSLSFYYHQHELQNISYPKYSLINFFDKPIEPEVDYYFKRGKNNIPIYKLNRIVGTVIAKDDTRHIVTLLTLEGVVPVKFSAEYYSMFKKQISKVDPVTKKKTVLEKSWFTRGNILMVQGYRREDQWISKNYKNTGYHQLYKITDIDKDGNLSIMNERISNIEEENEYGEY